VSRLEPLVLAYRRYKIVLPVAPGHVVVVQHLVGRRAKLRFKRKRMAEGIRGAPEGAGNTLQRVSIDAVRSYVSKLPGESFCIRQAFLASALVPQHGGKEHMHPVPMESSDKLLYCLFATGKIRDEVILVAIVDADVRIGRPYEHAVDAAVARL
jgi:hypothetical protein